MSRQNVSTFQKLKAEADEGLTESLTSGGNASKQQNLMELEAIKTMTWHKKPLLQALNELGYEKAYSNCDAGYFKDADPKVEITGYKDGVDKLGTDLHKRLGLPDSPKVLEEQRKQ